MTTPMPYKISSNLPSPTNLTLVTQKMASFLTYNVIFFFFFLSPLFISTSAKFSEQFIERKANIRIEKTSHLHFYFHDTVSGNHPTAVNVAGKRNSFGGTVVVDDPLTEGVEPGSKIIGRAQGMYLMSSQDLKSLLMVMTFAFEEGIYNGSSLSVFGRNPFLESVREMPLVGGSGIFRLARGSALAKTEKYNVKTGDAVVEYDVYVMH